MTEQKKMRNEIENILERHTVGFSSEGEPFRGTIPWGQTITELQSLFNKRLDELRERMINAVEGAITVLMAIGLWLAAIGVIVWRLFL